MPGCRGGGTFAGIALIDSGRFDGVVGDGLHGTRKPFYLAAILSAGRRDMECQQIAQRIDGHVDLRTLLAFALVIAVPLAAIGCGAQRAAINAHCAGFCLAALCQAQRRALIVDQRLEASRRQPTLRLLVHRRPRRKVVWRPSLRCACLHDMPQSVEHLAQIMLPLAGILALQKQIRRNQRTLLIQYQMNQARFKFITASSRSRSATASCWAICNRFRPNRLGSWLA